MPACSPCLYSHAADTMVLLGMALGTHLLPEHGVLKAQALVTSAPHIQFSRSELGVSQALETYPTQQRHSRNPM